MGHPTQLNLVLTLSAFALASCGENPAETEASANLIDAPSAFGYRSNSWTGRARMPEDAWRYGLTAGVVDASGQSTVYVFGGRYNELERDPPAATTLAYDVDTDRWSWKAASFWGAATNGTGRIGDNLYISGGWDFRVDSDDWTDISKGLFAYDWRRDRLVSKADMPVATGDGVTGVINGKLYVLAGKCLNQELCRNFYRYDPARNTWTTLPRAPRSHRHGAGVVVGEKFYVAGGGASPFRSLDVYDPATNRWTTRAPLPSARQFAVGGTAEGRVYVIGIEGGDREGNSSANRNTHAYTPSTNTWATKAPYPGPRGEGGQFLLRPAAAVRVMFSGRAHMLAVGSGLLYNDGSVRPAGTIDPARPYIYRP